MNRLIKSSKRSVFSGYLILLLCSPALSFSQNLVTNPDFGLVTVQYTTRKLVRPIDWYAFEGSRPRFIHPAMKETVFPPSPIVRGNGAIYMSIMKYDQGIFTKLSDSLVGGSEYYISVDLEKKPVLLNSSHYRGGNIKDARTGRVLDYCELDYNYPIGLVVYFSKEQPSCNMASVKHYVVIDVPDEEQMPMQNVRTLSAKYLAKGGEQYFGIGLCSPDEYKAALNDTIDYYHKWACYGFYGVNVSPIPSDIQSFNVSFAHNALQVKFKHGSRFTIRDINFEYNSCTLSNSAKTELSAFAKFLQQNCELHVRIEGHADTVGTENFNQELSEKRAKSVYDYLVYLEVAHERLMFEGKGEMFPLDSSQVQQNMGVNRRVEFELVER